MKELKQLRKFREKHYLNDDGTFTVNVYENNIHYKKNGEYLEINNDFIDNGEFIINDTNNQVIKFYKKGLKLYDYEIEDYKLEFSIENQNLNKLNFLKNHIKYSNILDNIDIEYELKNNKLKENIILKNKDFDIDKISFKIKTNALLKLENNMIKILDKNNNILSIIDKPFLIDSNNKKLENLKVTLESNKEEFIYSIELDKNWLNNDDVKYPVTLDPTIINTVGDNVYDTFISSLNPDINRDSSNILSVGADDGDVRRTLLKFELPELSSSHTILGAFAYLRAYDGCIYSEENREISVHEITTDWAESTATWNTMNANYNPKVETYFYPARHIVINDEEEALSEIDITNLAKKWYSGGANNGIMLKWENETESDTAFEYTAYSKYYDLQNETGLRPYFSVNYTNQNGIKDYMEYTKINFSDGATSINNCNGNVINSFFINETISKIIPINLKIINSSEATMNNDGTICGSWRFNIEEQITFETIDDVEYAIYKDATNSITYLKKEDTYYVDEEGLNIKLETHTDGYVLTDKENNQKIFKLINEIYRLSKVINNDNNYVEVNYTNGKVTSLEASDNKHLVITYSDNKITITNDKDESIINISDGKLSSIETLVGKTQFVYNANNLIEKIIDISGQYATYEYYGKPYKLKKVIQYGNDDTQGNSLEFSYGYNSTTIKDKNNKTNTYTFDNLGHTVSTMSSKNNSTMLKDMYGYSDKYVDSINKKASSTTIVKYVDNLIENGIFEEGKECNFTYEGPTLEAGEGKIGTYGLRMHTTSEITYPITESDDYTFSFYLKTDIMYGLHLMLIESYEDTETLLDEFEIKGDFIDYKYQRYYLSGYFRNGSTLKFKLLQDDNVNTYIDQLQLEKGKVMNQHNLLQNSSFQSGTEGWDLSSTNLDTGENQEGSFSVVDINSEEKALKISSKSNVDSVASQSFEVSGKKGDTFNLSFFYKNEGIFETETGEIGCAVNMLFWSDSDEGQGTWNYPLNIHSEGWQAFNEIIVAENDYTSFEVNIMSLEDVNDFYITDITLTKDSGAYKFEYDDNGNLVSTASLDKKTSTMSYDVNNQMVSTTTARENSYVYEYDNEKISLIKSNISPSGLTSKNEYSQKGNITKIITEKIATSIDDNHIYQIRAKGTDKYIYVDGNKKLIIKEEECNNKNFVLTNVENNIFRIGYSRYYLNAQNNTLNLSQSESDSSKFVIDKNNNGSFTISLFSDQTKAIAISNDTLIIEDKNNESYAQQFYFEDIENNLYIEEINEYDENDEYLTKNIDCLGKETLYENDEKGLLKSETEANGKRIEYEYDEKERLISKKSSDNKVVNYEYNDKNELTKIENETIKLNFEYDSFDRIKDVKVNNYLISNSEYDNITGNLTKSTYGNNQTINYEYNDFNEIKKIIKDKEYEFVYNNLGDLAEINSSDLNIKYIYDFARRLSLYFQDEFNIDFTYDDDGNVSQKVYNMDTFTFCTTYEYNDDNVITKVTTNDVSVDYTYDYLDRTTNKNINNLLNIEYQYLTNGLKTSTIVKSMSINDDTYEFEYDDVYNITKIKLNDEVIQKYTYNILNELTSEENKLINKKYEYIYDNNGNIKKVKQFDLTTKELEKTENFEYNNETYSDLVTKYNDITITYDAGFNPLTIGTDTLEWKNGHELVKYTKGDNVYEYKYDVSGIRTSKIINGVETKYFLENNKVMGLSNSNDNVRLFFLRDEDGELIGISKTSTNYIYKKNFQNDIIGIYDESGNAIVNYEYDAWGNILSVKDQNGNEITDENNIGLLNPFRYRSYYYDQETDLYYLNKRYYSPKLRRFISIDAIVSSTNTNLGMNLFLYCNNNPVLLSDNNGHFTFWDALDVVSFVDSAYQMIKEPSLPNFFFLALDTVAVVPLIPSVGTVSKTADAIANVNKASKGTKTGAVVGDATRYIGTPNQIGKMGEDAVRNAYGFSKAKRNFIEEGRKRIPDIFEKGILGEVKNTKYMSYTKQLRDYKAIADREGVEMVLFVRPEVFENQQKYLSKQLRESGIKIMPIPFIR